MDEVVGRRGEQPTGVTVQILDDEIGGAMRRGGIGSSGGGGGGLEGLLGYGGGLLRRWMCCGG